MDEKILHEILAEIKDIKTGMAAMQQDIKDLKSDMIEVKKDTKVLKKDTIEVKTDTKELSMDIKNFGYTDVSQYAYVIQVIPLENYKVYVYFDTGHIKLYDCKELLNVECLKGIEDIEIFKKSCCILNHSLSFDLVGNRDEWSCYSIDSEIIFEKGLSVAECPVEKGLIS